MARDFKSKPSVNGTLVVIASDSVDALGDVTIVSPVNNQVLTYETSSSQWKNKVNAPSFSRTFLLMGA